MIRVLGWKLSTSQRCAEFVRDVERIRDWDVLSGSVTRELTPYFVERRKLNRDCLLLFGTFKPLCYRSYGVTEHIARTLRSDL